jgi:hypothetical protein
MQKIIMYSFTTLLVIFIIGCGGSTKGNTVTQSVVQNSNKAVSVDGLTQLKNTSKLDRLSQSGVNTSYDSASTSKDAQSLCNTGSIEINNNESTKVITGNVSQCTDGSSTLDGSATVKFEGKDNSNITARVTRDISLKDTENSFSIEKDATLNINLSKSSNKNDVDVKTTFKSKINGVAINVSGFSVNVTSDDTEDDKDTLIVKAGEFNIGEYYFQIDESKNNAIDNNGGTIYMTDGAGHKVELVLAENEPAKLKVDENNDGIFTDNEILNLNKQ